MKSMTDGLRKRYDIVPIVLCMIMLLSFRNENGINEGMDNEPKYFKSFKEIAFKAFAESDYEDVFSNPEYNCLPQDLTHENTTFYNLQDKGHADEINAECFILETMSCIGYHGTCGNLILVIKNINGRPKVILEECGYVSEINDVADGGYRKFTIKNREYGGLPDEESTTIYSWNGQHFEQCDHY